MSKLALVKQRLHALDELYNAVKKKEGSIVCAGSAALHSYLWTKNPNKPPNWNPSDIDIWIGSSVLDINMSIPNQNYNFKTFLYYILSLIWETKYIIPLQIWIRTVLNTQIEAEFGLIKRSTYPIIDVVSTIGTFQFIYYNTSGHTTHHEPWPHPGFPRWSFDLNICEVSYQNGKFETYGHDDAIFKRCPATIYIRKDLGELDSDYIKNKYWNKRVQKYLDRGYEIIHDGKKEDKTDEYVPKVNFFCYYAGDEKYMYFEFKAIIRKVTVLQRAFKKARYNPAYKWCRDLVIRGYHEFYLKE